MLQVLTLIVMLAITIILYLTITIPLVHLIRPTPDTKKALAALGNYWGMSTLFLLFFAVWSVFAYVCLSPVFVAFVHGWCYALNMEPPHWIIEYWAFYRNCWN